MALVDNFRLLYVYIAIAAICVKSCRFVNISIINSYSFFLRAQDGNLADGLSVHGWSQSTRNTRHSRFFPSSRPSFLSVYVNWRKYFNRSTDTHTQKEFIPLIQVVFVSFPAVQFIQFFSMLYHALHCAETLWYVLFSYKFINDFMRIFYERSSLRP